MSDTSDLLNAALELADLAKAQSVNAWRNQLVVNYKQDGTSVTDADLSIEARWREELAQRFPEHGILGEEYGAEAGSSAFTWVLDPIDGTRQFGSGLLNYASLISVCRDGVPIVGIIDLPVQDARYVAAEGGGTRFAGRIVQSSDQQALDESIIALANPESFQGSSLAGFENLRAHGRARVYDGGSPAYGALSRGLVDICINGDDLDAFDICALCPVVQEAGGVITDWKGDTLGLQSSGAIVASASNALHQQVLETLVQ